MKRLARSAQRPSLSCARAPRAGLTAARRLRRPMAQPEEARCSRRAAMQLLFNVPANGPRVSSSAKLARAGITGICGRLALVAFSESVGHIANHLYRRHDPFGAQLRLEVIDGG